MVCPIYEASENMGCDWIVIEPVIEPFLLLSVCSADLDMYTS